MPLFDPINDTFEFLSGNDGDDDVAGDGLVDQLVAFLPVDPFPDPAPEDNPFLPENNNGIPIDETLITEGGVFDIFG